MYHRVFQVIIWVFIVVGTIYFLLFYGFVIRALLALDKLPTYNNPDPKILGFDGHARFIYIWSSIFFFLAPISVIVTMVQFITHKGRNRMLKFVSTFLILLLVYHLFMDPYLDWFLD
jgi:hypothetical protein